MAACIISLAALNVVPSINNDALFNHNFVVFSATLSHLYHFFVRFINLFTLFANFTHLTHLAASAVQRKAAAIAAHHTHHVTTATATVIAISSAISHANWAFSSLRLNAQYQMISL
jgi:hypothetical protein